MIYSLHGTLVEKTADMAVVECAGVGFCAAIPSSTAGSLPAVGQECTLYTHMNVTENDVALFGFADKESQAMFRLLTAVTGVGPKVGLAILSALSPARVVLAVQAQAALVGLGYTAAEAAAALAGVDPALPVQEMIRLALQGIGRRR